MLTPTLTLWLLSVWIELTDLQGTISFKTSWDPHQPNKVTLYEPTAAIAYQSPWWYVATVGNTNHVQLANDA